VAFRLPLVVASGQRQQLQAGDTLLVGALSVSGGVLDAYASSGVVIGGGADPGASCLRVGNDIYVVNHLYFETASAAWVGTTGAGVALRFGVGGSEVARFATSGGLNLADTTDVANGNARAVTYICNATTGDKLIMFPNTYGLGVESGTWVAWSNGSWSFRGASRTGTEVLNITSAGSIILSGTILPPNASGTNIAGSTLPLRGGAGTGTGTPGVITFSTTDAGTTGTTVQSQVERVRIMKGVNIGGTTDPGIGRLQVTTTDGVGTNIIIKDTSTGAPIKGLEIWSTVSQAAFQLNSSEVQIFNYLTTGTLVLGVNSIARLSITSTGGIYIGGGTPSVDPGSSNLTVAGVIKIGGGTPLQVVGARKTGWTAATGTATRTSFATSTVTTAALAQAVKALIDDLISHGLIGA
jgi:hypothetical protein